MENNIINIVNDINEKIDIVKVIGEHINLKKKGNSYVGLCPFHQDSNPSLSVHPTKKIFKCFVCGAKGSAISFVQQIKKITFLEALKNVCDTNNIDLKKYHLETKNSYLDEKLKYLYNVNLHVLKYYQGFLLKKENAFALNYLHKRHLDKKIIDYFKIGYAPNNSLIHKICTNDKNMFGSDYDQSLVWSDQQLLDASLININDKNQIYDFFLHRIIFPIFDHNNHLVAFSGRAINDDNNTKYLNSRDTKIFAKQRVLYNLNNFLGISNQKTIIIVEGYIDVIAYYRANFLNAVATMGTMLTSYHIKLLQNIGELKNVILSYDNDRAGTEANIRNGKMLVESGFNVSVIAKYEDKYKDVDELINACSIEALTNVVEKRIDFISYLIIQTLNNEMADDEKINCVNEILKYIVKNGEMLYKTTHISLISSLSGINSADLELKYEKFMKTDDLDYNLSSLKPTNTQKIMIDNSSKLNLNSQKALDCIKNNFIILLDYLLIDNELLTKMNNQNLLINYWPDELMNIKGIYIIICNLYKTTRKINHETLKDYVNSKINDTNNEMKNYQTIINKLDAKTNYTSAQTIINILTTINSNIFNYQNQLIEQNPHTSELLSIKHQLNHDYHRSIKLINSLFPS